MKTRMLLVYDDLFGGTGDNLSPLKRELMDKYNDEITIYNIGLTSLGEFVRESGEYSHVFYESSLKKEEIQCHFNGNTSFIKGVVLTDEEVKKFIHSL